ncbi:hypothetical protein GZH49_10575 [Nocardia terpenica]|uniref:terpene synthase family protein n=1 Tax=Nocardia terpenica TaxID=455432 RepID=UPI002FE1AC36
MDAIEQDTWLWLDRHHLVDNDAMRRHMIRARPQYTSALYWPRTDVSHLRACNWYMNWAFIVDDALDDAISMHDHARVARVTDDLIGVAYGVKESSTYAERGLEEIIYSFSVGRSSQWRWLMGETHKDWLRTYPIEARANDMGRRMRFAEYVPHRASGVNERIFMHLNEYVRDIDLPSEIRNLPAMTQARDRAVEWVGLYNDIYSFVKEDAVGYRYNAVAVVRDELHCSVQEAVDIVGMVLDGLIDQFQAACAAVPAQARAVVGRERDVSDMAMQTLEGYKQTVRGNFDYHIDTPRYTEVSDYMPPSQTAVDNRRPDWSTFDIFSIY